MLSKLDVNENDVFIELRKRKIQRDFCFYNYKQGINLKQINNFNLKTIQTKNNNSKNYFSEIFQDFLKFICIDLIKK